MKHGAWAFALAAVAAVGVGCGGDDLQFDDDDDGGGAGAGDSSGNNGTGVGAGGSPPQVVLEVDPVFGVTNVDDDDQNGVPDFSDPYLPGEDDLSPVVIGAERLAELEVGAEIRLTLAGNIGDIRVFHDGVAVLGAETGITTYTLAYAGQPPNLEVEFGNYFAQGALAVELLDAEGVTTEWVEARVMAAPLILNHHVQPLERAWVLATSGNADMRNDFQTVLADRFEASPGQPYGFDVWLQDEPQFATQTGNHGERQDVIIDSIRDRGLDPWPEDRPNGEFGVSTWGNPNFANTFDSFGNLEVSPPVGVAGTDYPFGRIYYGKRGNAGLGDELATFLASQLIQAPVEIDTTWLCVGHVDEFSTFIPDPNSEKGFKLLFADTRSAYQILDGLDPAYPIPRYTTPHGVSTAGDIRNSSFLTNFNNTIQEDYLDPILDQFKAEFGLTDDDVILVPSLFEECGPASVALVPGMVNLIVANPEGATPTLIVPDPFFRVPSQSADTDPFAIAFRDAMPEGLDVVFTDAFFTYHVNLGEVHCGTAVQRTPDPKAWWVEGRDLLPVEETLFQ
ncbi:MAG: protein-arginine deiminase family protein [Myxococcota bacterium]